MGFGGRSRPILEEADRLARVPVACRAIDEAVIRDLSSAAKGTRPYVGVEVSDVGNWGSVDDGLCLKGADDVNVVEPNPAEDGGDDARRRAITLALVPLFTGKSRTMDSKKRATELG